MPPPNWRTAVAMDGETRISTLQHDDGSVSIRLVAGAISIVVAVTSEQWEFLGLRPTDAQVERAA